MKTFLFAVVFLAGLTSCQNKSSSTEKKSNHYEDLKSLSWLIGDWVDDDTSSEITRKVTWDDHKNFIIEKFTYYVPNQADLKGQQIIGWDASQDRIRSWVFDSDGGTGEGYWNNEGDYWTLDLTYTLPDGSKASAVYVYTDINHKSYVLQSTGRIVGGEILPNLDPVNVTKKG